MSRIFKPRRGTAYTMNNTDKKNTILAKGEFFIEVPNAGAGTGPSKIKIGDGVRKYADLPVALSGTDETEIIDSTATTADEALDNMVSGEKVSKLLGELKKAVSLNLATINRIDTDTPFKFKKDMSQPIKDRYGYVRDEDGTFVPFRSQADVDNAAAAASEAATRQAMQGTASQAQVLTGYTFTNDNTSGLDGRMPNNSLPTPWSKTINPGAYINIPAGYHNGSGRVTANPNQNSGTYTCPTGWTGSPVTGGNGDMGINNANRFVNATNVYNKGKADGEASGGSAARVGTASAAQVLTGYTFTNSSGSGLPGNMPNNGSATRSINAGSSVNLAAGYYSAGTITANRYHDDNTYTFPANDTGGTKDLQPGHNYRRVNATNVYNKGLSDGAGSARSDGTLDNNKYLASGKTAYGLSGNKYTGTAALKTFTTDTLTPAENGATINYTFDAGLYLNPGTIKVSGTRAYNHGYDQGKQEGIIAGIDSISTAGTFTLVVRRSEDSDTNGGNNKGSGYVETSFKAAKNGKLQLTKVKYGGNYGTNDGYFKVYVGSSLKFTYSYSAAGSDTTTTISSPTASGNPCSFSKGNTIKIVAEAHTTSWNNWSEFEYKITDT